MQHGEPSLVLCYDLDGWDGGRGERFRREGMYVYLWLILIVVWQELAQHCKAITPQLKIKKIK